MKRVLCFFAIALSVFMLCCCENNSEKTNTAQRDQNGGNKTITIYSLKDDTLCPILTDNEANRQMLNIVYEPLVRLKSNMEAEGVLATNWSVSPDGLVWTITLRSGVKWHNGKSFSAEDVIYTVNQIKSAQAGAYIYNVSLISDISGAGKTVSISLTEPSPNFVNLLTFPIIKSEENDIEKESYTPLGTGPYVFSDKNEGNMYYLLKNENWWGEEIKLDEIRVKLLPDSETVMYSFSAGDIDIANTEWGKWGRFVNNADVRSSSCFLPVYDFIGINHNNPVLKNKEVRKVINFALKKNKIVNDIFAGNAVEALSPIRGNWFINGNEKEKYEADSTGAENLLLRNEWKKKSGVYEKKTENGVEKLSFKLIVNQENSNRMNISESVKLDLEAIGMEINVIPLSFEEYENRILSGDYDLFIGSVMLPDDLNFEFLLGHGNIFNYEDTVMLEILSDIKKAVSKEQIINGYGKLKKRFASEIPFAGLCFENFDMLYSKRVKGELSSTPSSIYDGIYNLYIGE